MYSNIDEAWKISNDLDKYRKNAPVISVKDATNSINFESSAKKSDKSNKSDKSEKNTRSAKISTPNSAIFETELRDLKKLVKKDDGTQCQRLFSHFQVCQKCRNKIVEKFSLNTVEQPSTLKFTESFIDFSKYTDLLKDKNTNNIVSIILFGLLVIIILSMINNDRK
jgi:hypothetical protein